MTSKIAARKVEFHITAIKDRMGKKMADHYIWWLAFLMISWLSFGYHSEKVMAIFPDSSNSSTVSRASEKLWYHTVKYRLDS